MLFCILFGGYDNVRGTKTRCFVPRIGLFEGWGTKCWVFVPRIAFGHKIPDQAEDVAKGSPE